MSTKKFLFLLMIQSFILFSAKSADTKKLTNWLFDAAEKEEIETVFKLLDIGVDINTQEEVDGKTLLHIFSLKGFGGGVDKLLKNPAIEVNIAAFRSFNESTPLHCAVWKNKPRVVGLLLNAKACVNSPSWNGNRPLHIAAALGLLDIVKMLLVVDGIELDVVTSSGAEQLCFRGCTPLHLAVLGGHINIVRELCAAGADRSICDSDRMTPWALAKDCQREKSTTLTSSCALQESEDSLPEELASMYEAIANLLQSFDVSVDRAELGCEEFF